MKTAFLNGILKEEAPWAWYDLLSKFLLSQKFIKGAVDVTLFTQKEEKHIFLVQINVNDIIFASTNLILCDKFAKEMSTRFKMSMMGKISFLLGLQVYQNPRGIFINQSKYAPEMLKRYGLENNNGVDTPIVESSKLNEDPQGTPVDPTCYRSMVVKTQEKVLREVHSFWGRSKSAGLPRNISVLQSLLQRQTEAQAKTPDAQLLLKLKKGANESKRERILKEIRKALREGSGATPDSPNHSNSFSNSIWYSNDDDKTKSVKILIMEMTMMILTKTLMLEKIRQQEDYNRLLNESLDVEMSDLLNEPMYIKTQKLIVVPLLESISEVQEQDLVDQVMGSSLAATTTITPPTKSTHKRAKKLLKKAIRRKNDSNKVIMQKLEEYEKKLNALAQIDHAESIQDSVKNQLPKFMPKVVSKYV
nr:hypothetical protein [Tanacetum cinerariifolium]